MAATTASTNTGTSAAKNHREITRGCTRASGQSITHRQGNGRALNRQPVANTRLLAASQAIGSQGASLVCGSATPMAATSAAKPPVTIRPPLIEAITPRENLPGTPEPFCEPPMVSKEEAMVGELSITLNMRSMVKVDRQAKDQTG